MLEKRSTGLCWMCGTGLELRINVGVGAGAAEHGPGPLSVDGAPKHPDGQSWSQEAPAVG